MAHDVVDGIAADIQGITGGRPYVFVVRAFNERYGIYEDHIRSVVESETGLLCIDAEGIPGAGHELLTKVHLLIERSELVVAEISNVSPNVFYEVGYATAIGKPLILVMEEGHDVPVNLRGRVLIQYTQSALGLESLDRQLGIAVLTQITASVSSLRDMLLAKSQLPAYIVSSPKHRGPGTRIVYEGRTFGDNLGVRGLLSAFGVMLGSVEGVELVSAQISPPDLTKHALNLYLIGSRKVNPLTEEMLTRLQKDCDTVWALGPADREDKQVEDYKLTRTSAQGEKRFDGATESVPSDDGTVGVYVEDYGLVLRGPHPDHADRLVLIMAGAHSVGTGAACLAATHPPLIREVARRLQKDCEVNLADRDQTIWALVHGCVSEETGYLLDPDHVTVQEVGAFEPVREKGSEKPE